MIKEMGKSFLFFVILLIILFCFSERGPFFTSKPQGQAITMKEVTKELGIDYLHGMKALGVKNTSHLQPWTKGAGSSVAIADINNDGFSDIFFPSQKGDRAHFVYKNLKNGRFEEVGQIMFPKFDERNVVSGPSIFFDCDNDGDQDLFYTTYSCPRLFENKDGKFFTNISQTSAKWECIGANSNVLDVNNDGLLDIVYATYTLYGENETIDSLFSASNVKQYAHIYLNQGKCTFSKMENSLVDKVGLSHTVGVADINNDGRSDLWFVTDFGSDKVFLNNNGTSFIDKSHLISHSYSRHGMSFDLYYDDKEQDPLFFVSHIYEPKYRIEGNSFWKYEETGFKNKAFNYNIYNCRHAWGAKFIDIDLDGDQDLFVVNGFISNSKTSTYEFDIAQLSISHRNFSKDIKNWPKFGDKSYFGHEKSCFFENRNGKFVKSSAGDFTRDRFDGRGLAFIDINNDGNQSLVVANQHERAQVFSLKKQPNAHWVGLFLEGKCSNRNAFGTSLILKEGDEWRKRYFQPPNGFSAQNDSKLVFGIKNPKAPIKLDINWPSGFSQSVELKGLNRYYKIIEKEDCESIKKVSKY